MSRAIDSSEPLQVSGGGGESYQLLREAYEALEGAALKQREERRRQWLLAMIKAVMESELWYMGDR